MSRALQHMDDEIDEWIREKLFPEDFFEASTFPDYAVLFRRPLPWPLIEGLIHERQVPAPFTRGELYTAVVRSCGEAGHNRSAAWFHVNVHDNCAFVLEWCQDYAYPLTPLVAPLQCLYDALESKPAQEGGTTYSGLLGVDRDWILVFERERDFVVTFAGTARVCQRVRQLLGLATPPPN